MGQSLSNPSPSSTANPSPSSTATAADDEDCGLSLYMKAGGCRDTFTEWWQKCLDDGGKNKEKCFQATSALQKCMEENSNYFEPLLVAKHLAEKMADAWMSELEEAEKKMEKYRANKKKKADRTQKKEDSI